RSLIVTLPRRLVPSSTVRAQRFVSSRDEFNLMDRGAGPKNFTKARARPWNPWATMDLQKPAEQRRRVVVTEGLGLHRRRIRDQWRFAMAIGLENEQKELAEYVRVGSKRGHQCFGSYFDERGGSCALGAVYEGVYHLPREHGKLIPDHLERLFRCLDEVTKRCPQGCSKRLPLASMIVHLNDDHRMTREQIAEWLTQ